MTLAELREALNKEGVKVSVIAELSGISRMSVNRIKKGETDPNMGTFERLVLAVQGIKSPPKVRKAK